MPHSQTSTGPPCPHLKQDSDQSDLPPTSRRGAHAAGMASVLKPLSHPGDPPRGANITLTPLQPAAHVRSPGRQPHSPGGGD